MMVVSQMENAKKYCLGSGVAPQTPIPLYTMGQKRFFWIPGMGVFGMRNTNNYWGFLGWRSVHTHTHLSIPEPKQYFLALCSSNTPIPGIQKHFCWPMGYRDMGV